MDDEKRKYDRSDEERVKKADIRLFIPGANMRKLSQDKIECPFCGEKKFGVNAKKGANYARCYKCEQGFSNPIQAVMHYEGLDYLRALERTAEIAGIIITPQEHKREKAVKEAKAQNEETFCAQQLKGSGLTESDVMACVEECGLELFRSPFRKGRVTDRFIADESGDDMLIYYYDLNGKPMMYTPKGASKARQYVRVRWSNPALHKDKSGKEIKYQTPEGAKSRVYIPEKIRRLYKEKQQIETLFLQEGEKKAEKACKHGMLSIGIQGINNFGSQEEGLLQDIQDLAKRCKIQNIVLVMDSDWNDLHRNIVIGERVDKRPNSFSKAVIKFRQYMRTFHTLGLSVDIWWGHVNTNEHGDKGVDDLLCGSLLGKESELLSEVAAVMNSHDGKGTWLNIHKITAESDDKIRDFWLLNDVQAFYDLHKDRLESVETFKIGNIRYKAIDGKIAAVSRYASAGDIYTITQNSKGENKVEFNGVEAFRFLTANGFYRLKDAKGTAAAFEYIRIDDGIIDRIAPYEIRDFIRDYIKANCKSEMVLQYFTDKLATKMQDKQLENLDILLDDFNRFEKGIQRTYYNNGQVEVTSRTITPDKPISQVWRSRIIPRIFKRVEIIKSIRKDTEKDRFEIEYTDEAAKCEFLTYLINTSNNCYTAGKERELSEEEYYDWVHHIVNKITTLGFLLTDYKYSTERKAVVVQEHQISEVGQSNGGAGKSLLGDAISRLVPQYFINGKQINFGDEFLLSGVTRETRNIYIDDIHTNFDFSKLYPMVTSNMTINPKGKDRYTIALGESPKILITTNHAINKASDGSTQRRISYMEYSAWYNVKHTPMDDFHHMLFEDWDEDQWNLFDNLMTECVMYYLRSFEEVWSREGEGAVPPPMRNIELRTLRQEMGETFLAWAEEFYDPEGPRLNERLVRKDIWDSFEDYAGGAMGSGTSKSGFRKKVEKFCKYKGYDFNPSAKNSEGETYKEYKAANPDAPFIGGDDKTNSKEYLTVYSKEKADRQIKPF